MNDDDVRWLQTDLQRQVEDVELTAGEVDGLIATSAHRVRRQRRVQRITTAVTLLIAVAVAGGVVIGATHHHEPSPSTVPPATADGPLPPRWSAQYNEAVLLRIQKCLAAAGVASERDGETGLRVTSPSAAPSAITSCTQGSDQPIELRQLTDDELEALYSALRSRISCLVAHGTQVEAAPDLAAWRTAVRADAGAAWSPYSSAPPEAVQACPKP